MRITSISKAKSIVSDLEVLLWDCNKVFRCEDNEIRNPLYDYYAVLEGLIENMSSEINNQEGDLR